MQQKINLLNKIGLTDSEAKVYLALVQNGSLSGYEASKMSLVPRSKIYNVLESLVSKGFIIFTENSNSNTYAAINIEEVSKNIKYEMNNTLDKIEEELKEFESKTDLEYIWHIKEYKNVFAKCRNIIKNTKKELYLQIWEEDFLEIIEEVKELEELGVNIGTILYSNSEDIKVPLKSYYRHGLASEKYKEMGGRWITVVSDSREVVFGQIINKNSVEVIWTESKPMIFMAKEYVKHDMYFYKSVDMFKESMQKELGKEYYKIRDIF
ncbi:MAG: TrmB family transcriptional regulator [Paeniclostridium sordellii]|nr:TrmB family transcriptional regulator [Paeniclostridium sordellii]